MYVVLVVRRIAAAVGHIAPAFTVALDVPDVLVPYHVVDPERLRIGLGPSFVVALDAGRSPQSKSTQIYIGLGYPF